MNGSVKWWLSFLIMALAAYGGYSAWRIGQRIREARRESPTAASPAERYSLRGTPVEPFKLIERSGEEFDSQELDGKVWVASFFFSSCPGACLRMNNIIARLQTELAEADVRFVSITVDPENDTPDVLEKYARHYSADPQRWRFLTGPPHEIKHIANDVFKVAYGREAHSDRLIVVDREGKIQGAYPAMDDAQMVLMKRKLDELTRENTEGNTNTN